MPGDRAVCALDCADRLGEGPVWSVAEQALYWVDVPRPSLLHRWVPDTGAFESRTMPEMVLAVSVRQSGGLLVASARALNHFDWVTGAWKRLVEPEPDLPANRINDAGTDRAGRFWFGTLQNNFADDNSDVPITCDTGSLYRYDPGGQLTRHATNLGAPNTVAWSPDNRTLYYADTVSGCIYASEFDLVTGTIGNRRLLARNPEFGAPDGSAIDSEGCLWNCRLGAGCVIRYRPDGSIDRILPVPTRMVTSCAFGGPDLGTLYITTARFYLSEQELAAQPKAGGLFHTRLPGVRGIEQPLFAG